MTLFESFLIPSHDGYEWLALIWQWVPVVRLLELPLSVAVEADRDLIQFTAIQWTTAWQPMGKTSIHSKLNLPGRLAWVTMETPGIFNMAYIVYTLPKYQGIEWTDLPWWNKVLAALYVST